MKRRTFISILLVLCMLFQSFAPVFARPVEGAGFDNGKADVSDVKEQFDEAYEKIMGIDPIELDGGTTFAVGLGSFLNDPFGCIGDALGFDTDYENYVEKIKEANEKIAEAQQKASEMKTEFDNGKFDETSKMDANKLAQGALTEQQNVNKECQETLKETGDMLVKVGGILDTISTILGILGPICDILSVVAAVPPFTGVAAVAKVIGAICDWGSIVLGPLAAYLTSTGEGLIEASEAGTWSDKELLNETVHKKQAEETIPAVAGSALQIVMKTEGAQNLVNKGIEKIGASSVAQKVFGENSTAVIKAVWEPDSIGQSFLSDTLGDSIPNYMKLVPEWEDKLFGGIVSLAGSADDFLFKEATGEDKPSVGGKSMFEDGVVGDGLKTTIQLIDGNYGQDAKETQESGLHTSGSGAVHGGSSGKF